MISTLLKLVIVINNYIQSTFPFKVEWKCPNIQYLWEWLTDDKIKNIKNNKTNLTDSIREKILYIGQLLNTGVYHC